MTDLLTAAQMRAIEHAAIESGEVTGLELMERAGQGVVNAIFAEWPELRTTSHRAVVLCGPGNNGGDGFVVARLLKEWGWEVEVFLYGDPEKLPPDARVNYDRWGELGETAPYPECDASFDVWRAALWVDALFGTGLTRPLDYPLGMTELEKFRNCDNRPRMVSIDIPSGFCADSGGTLNGDPCFADLTVTFHARKLGHFLAEGANNCGKVVVAGIGLENTLRGAPAPLRPRPEGGGEIAPTLGPGATLGAMTEPVNLIETIPQHILAKRTAHKYTHGHALVLSGPGGSTGASRLAARGALRVGAGLVTLAGPQNAQAEQCAQITSIMWREIKGAPGLVELLEDTRINALCLGPALGLGQGTAHLVLAALEANRATVLDADALSQFERKPQALFDALHEACVLTPHAGEFARLFPDIAEKLGAPVTQGPAYSKVDAAREAAARAGCTILFKGPDTVIADPGGGAAINSSAYDRAVPWLATAGTGDVLAGFITGLLARGLSPMKAASTGAWLHTECARSFGPGLISEDLPEELPKVFRELGL